MFIQLIAALRESKYSLRKKSIFESLKSISAVVTSKEKRDMLAEDIFTYSDDENSSESEPDEDEYECVVCRLEFVGEAKFEKHRRVSGHWG